MFTLILLPTKGVNSHKTPNAQNIKTFILSKVLQRFKPNLAQRYRPPSSLRESSQYTPDKSKMADAAILKKTVKSPYLRNRLTDFDEIWHNDVDWPPTGNISLKFRIFQKPRWRRPLSWKTTKIAISQQRIDISSRNLARLCKMGLLTAQTVKFEFPKSKMADGRQFVNR